MIELLNMDCLQYMKEQQDNAFDFVVTSPPYGTLRDYGKDFNPEAKIWQKVIPEIKRILKKGGVACWVTADQTINGSESGDSFRQALLGIESGLLLHDTIIWNKGGVRYPCKTRYYDTHEYIFIFSNGPPDYFNPLLDRVNKWSGTKQHGTDRQADGSTKKISNIGAVIPETSKRYTIWDVPNPGISGTEHPATFPLKLAYDMFYSWCPVGGKAYDPFLGSATSAIAAHKHGCDFVGTELDKDYYDAGVKRFNESTAQVSIFDTPEPIQKQAEMI